MSEGDLDDVLAIERASFPEPWTREAFVRELAFEDAVMRVWRDPANAKVRGNLVYRVVVDELDLHNVAVHPDARGQGIAKALMHALIDDGRRRAAARVTLEVRELNGAARRLYESLGFQAIGRRPHYYPDNGEAAVLYALELR